MIAEITFIRTIRRHKDIVAISRFTILELKQILKTFVDKSYIDTDMNLKPDNDERL